MNIAFLLAAGRSQRFGKDKLFEDLSGKPVIVYSLAMLQHSRAVDAIFVAANARNKKKIEALVRKEKFSKVKKIILGGASRFGSVCTLTEKLLITSYALHVTHLIIHNAANPFAIGNEIRACVKALRPGISGAAVGRPVQSTLKEVAGGLVKKTISRAGIWEMETPQVVRARDFVAACKKVSRSHADFTDDSAVLEAAGFKTAIVKASPRNKKITVAEDLLSFENLLSFPRKEASVTLLHPGMPPAPLHIRVGIGEDSHVFVIASSAKTGRSNLAKRNCLRLGGISIKNFPALEADSDGDVVLHALCNAISSALGGGSLGTYATKMAHRRIRNSKKYLEKILKKMNRANHTIYNCAISIEAARPRIDPLTPKIKKSLSILLKIPENRIGITATTGEKLTPFGKGKAIRCQAVVLLSC